MVRSDPQEIKVDIHHLSVVCLVMISLKAFLYGVAPLIGMTTAALYERQRALVKLGLLTPFPGRGPGSGVPFSAENAAAVIISVLASDSLSEVDERVVALCRAQTGDVASIGKRDAQWKAVVGEPTFHSEVANVLSGQDIQSGPARLHPNYRGIRVTRCWRGQIMRGRQRGASPVDFFVDSDDRHVSRRRISVTAEIEEEMLDKLILYTQSARQFVGDDQ
jgi:hypothetical protein